MLTDKEILKDRYEALKKQIEANLAHLKADTRDSANEKVEGLRAKLEELKTSVSDGWDKLTDDAAAKLNELLDRTADSIN